MFEAGTGSVGVAERMSDAMIRVRGARQNNLRNADLDLPLGRLIVITGPSGSGKSSLAFETLYAEGQRRYVETFSPYTRQFLERMDKPQADRIEGIPPAIALAQANAIRTTRSTVGTLTEIQDYLKLLFPRLAAGFCPSCARRVIPETPNDILEEIYRRDAGQRVMVTFAVDVPPRTASADFFRFLNSQGYLRVFLYGRAVRTDEEPPNPTLPPRVPVIQDRVEVTPAQRSRLREALETALRLGQGKIGIWSEARQVMDPHSSGWHCAYCDIDLLPPTPGLFSFNSPLGACPECKGFGRVIGIDWERVLPDRSLSIAEGVVRPFQSGVSKECQRDLMRAAARKEVDVHRPFCELPEADQRWVIEGNGSGSPEELWEAGRWYGVRGYFQWLETKTYKMHVRVLLSRYRSYCACPSCGGGRLRPETSNFRLLPSGLSLPQLNDLPLDRAAEVLRELPLAEGDSSAHLLFQQIQSRVECLRRVGLGYLTLNRPARTLSGGEIERVNLTACLGASLANTLFVLDEPSVGLHPRDTRRLVEVLQSLRDRGNTVVVVEHEEAVIRSADHLVDVGPGRGRTGGEILYCGPARDFADKGPESSLTRAYLTGRKSIPIPTARRKPKGFLKLRGIRLHNLKALDVDIPLGIFCCVTGVSGSGKSSLVQGVLHPLLSGEPQAEDVSSLVREVKGAEAISEVILVDQTPLSRTPRSTPAVYVGAWDRIRELFGLLPESLAAGLSPASFSFNSGDGRCGRCGGLGFEKVEMQFLSDLFIKCPECEGRRFRPAILEVRYQGLSIADVLAMSVEEALGFFAAHPGILQALQPLADVGLGYLALGQPLNELSGGESQRLKLAGHLAASRPPGSLLLFDEPTTGLHFDDIARLLEVFQRLVDGGDSLVVIEHNLEVIKCADYLLDLGPEAGEGGGRIVAKGPPEIVAQCAESHTGQFLRDVLQPGSASFHEELPPLLAPAAAPPEAIEVRGAREHNLKNISLQIPRGRMVVVTGLSGSGKSTLAFDILFAEGQRRFLDSMSAYARQFVEQMEKPDVDSVEGLPPTVAIEQRVTRGGSKSTVATITEAYHFLRLLYARVGVQHCPECQIPVVAQSQSAAIELVRKLARREVVRVLAPLVRGRKGLHTKVARWAESQGIERLIVNGREIPTAEFRPLDRYREHTIEAVVAVAKGRAAEDAALRALEIGKGSARVEDASGHSHLLSTAMNCPGCGRAFAPLHPRLFSFNSPHGWCPHCRGFGEIWRPLSARDHESVLEAELAEEKAHEGLEEGETSRCPVCAGTRLNETARHVLIGGVSICDVTRADAGEALRLLKKWKFSGASLLVAREILPEIERRLAFLQQVGLGYLSLDRGAHTLSGGESQRVRLAAQLGSNLRGVLYVLDEPTIGLHARDNSRLLNALEALARGGNSLVIVEHDEETMRRADHIVDLGPGAGSGGGEIVAQGKLEEILGHPSSATARALREPVPHPLQGARRPLDSAPGWLRLYGARLHNLQGVDAEFPLERLTVVTGVSGSGKSSLVRGVLEPAVRAALSKGRRRAAPDCFDRLEGAELLGGVLEVDQSPIGKTSRSTPATYIKVLDAIRQLYAGLPAARMRGYSPSRFSFNNEGGRCEACQGAGVIRLEMNFLPPAHVPCEECHGKRFNPATLEIEYNGKSIGDVMEMTAAEAAEFFAAHPKIRRPLDLMVETGLGYLRLGQASPTLSGGEAQRIKLVTELARRATGEGERLRTGRRGRSTLYILEEPTIGLHAQDVVRLIGVLHRLVEEGGTVVVVEHHLDVIAEADYILDLGPEAGGEGGRIVARGTPEDILKSEESRTAPFLAKVLGCKSAPRRSPRRKKRG